jgi:predicted GNAT family acetyltransferase
LTEISRESYGSKGRYSLRASGAEAELTYSITSPTLVIADHTLVPDAMRGTGAGLALVTQLVADARAEGFKIMPLCPFVNAQRKKHPEWADAFSV